MSSSDPSSDYPVRSQKNYALLVLLALIALGLNLRSPLTAVAPIINDIRQGLAISAAAAGLLTSIPVLCFGLLTPFASYLISRLSVEKSIFLILGATALGILLRPAGGIGLALAGTLVIGAALTVGNIVSLMVIARDFPRRLRLVTGIYASALNVGTMLSSALAAPLAMVLGWRMALAVMVVLLIPALVLWLLVGSHRKDQTPRIAANVSAARQQGGRERPVWRQTQVWFLAIAFGAHLFVYFGLTAWLPTYLIQMASLSKTEAGFAASLFQILALLGSFGVPVVAVRVSMQKLLLWIAVCWAITPLGLLAAPHDWLLWLTIGGIASGGGFTIIFSLIMANARNLDENRSISSLVQGFGYTVASSSPLIVGSLHQEAQLWTTGFCLLAVVALLMLLAGFGLIRIGHPTQVVPEASAASRGS